MKKCSKCDKLATSDNGLCNIHFAEWAAAEDEGVDSQEILEELIGRFGPDFEWFSDWFDARFGYKGKDKQKIYYDAYLELRDLIENAYDLGTLDGPDDEEEFEDAAEDADGGFETDD